MEAQIGRETTPKEYISRLTEVFTEVRRVLRPDGTLWLNISDTVSYTHLGKRYQSHAATIRRWAGEDAKKTITPSRNRDYSVKEDETV